MATYLQEVIATHGRIPEELRDKFNVKELIHYLNTSIIEHGRVDCPACRSHVEIYKRTISRALIYYMFSMRKLTNNGSKYVKAKEVDMYLFDRLKMNPSDAIILKHWNLVEHQVKFDKKRQKDISTGEYRLTKQGNDFIDGIIDIPRYVYLANGKVIKTSPEKMKYIDATNFDLNDLKQL
jgi:hypothetical protein